MIDMFVSAITSHYLKSAERETTNKQDCVLCMHWGCAVQEDLVSMSGSLFSSSGPPPTSTKAMCRSPEATHIEETSPD